LQKRPFYLDIRPENSLFKKILRIRESNLIKREANETNISTKQQEALQNPRVFKADVHQAGAKRHQSAQSKGAKAVIGVAVDLPVGRSDTGHRRESIGADQGVANRCGGFLLPRRTGS